MSIFGNCSTTDEVDELLAQNIEELEAGLNSENIELDYYQESVEQLNHLASERIMEIVLDGVLID